MFLEETNTTFIKEKKREKRKKKVYTSTFFGPDSNHSSPPKQLLAWSTSSRQQGWGRLYPPTLTAHGESFLFKHTINPDNPAPPPWHCVSPTTSLALRLSPERRLQPAQVSLYWQHQHGHDLKTRSGSYLPPQSLSLPPPTQEQELGGKDWWLSKH